MTRIHIVVERDEKERFRSAAEQEGKSLSEWLREAAREKLAAEGGLELDTLEALRAFWSACDDRAADREPGREPEWSEHREVIERSIRSGAADV